MKSQTLVLLCALAACADQSPAGDDVGDIGADGGADEAGDPTLAGADPADDTATMPDEALAGDTAGGSVIEAATTQVVFVNFGGPVIYACPTSAYCNDAVNRRHHYIRDSWGRSSIDFAPWGTSTQRTNVINFLRSRFASYRVAFTTTKPTSGEYTMLVISTTAVGATSLRGKTDTDCYPTSDGRGLFNSNHRDIAFVVRVGGVSSAWVERYAAHELAHSFGLLHVTSTSDLMHYKSYGYNFTAGSSYDNAHNPAGWRCVGGSTQNDPALLTKALGLK